ncbi:hypothetical protein HB662_19795 [Roseomonas frigidaquae]|uniref:Uncharacterized protein n=1 Tax=Falsiroseomonas frigidaquae TaxID=487318 RepID=A0ABX1F3Y1_9PROT|nr:hypothetical protein [Falsiroseomonas frigidaquae]NKE47033.1 hypothetical protein [Falsiroseomonas frigidaquae]
MPLNAAALPYLEAIAMELLPGARRRGAELRAGSRGEAGADVRLCLITGRWWHRHTCQEGEGAVSLLAVLRSTSEADAAACVASWMAERGVLG